MTDGASDDLVALAREVGACVVPADPLPVPPDQALLLVGSQAWKEADRQMARADVRTLQVLTADACITAPRADDFGPLGLREAVPVAGGTALLLSAGSDLTRLELASGARSVFDLGHLNDVHSVTPGPTGWFVANTGEDEVIECSEQGEVLGRRSLAPFRHRAARPIDHRQRLGGLFAKSDPAIHDHFHVNEAFVGRDGHVYAMVHHVDGYRPLHAAGARLIRHGDGGVLDLDEGVVHRLDLAAPHNVRPLGEGYLLLDSGRARALLVDARWRPVRSAPVPGWGRGLAVDDATSRSFVGLSATRPRYLKPGQDPGTNGVAVVDRDLTVLARRTVPGVEQVWSLALVTADIAAAIVTWLATA